MIAEVTSTPWRERQSYVLSAGPDGLRGDFGKRMHVSPFMPMEQSYEWSAGDPGERLSISIRNRQEGRIVFEAGLALERREMTPSAMREILFRYPPMTISTIARIYWNAARLKAKGAPYYRRPTAVRGRIDAAGADPWRRVVHAVLRRIEAGAIELEERFPGGETRQFGPTSAQRRARVQINDPNVYRKLARSKSIAFGQTYAERGWETDDLSTLLAIAARDIGRADPAPAEARPVPAPISATRAP